MLVGTCAITLNCECECVLCFRVWRVRLIYNAASGYFWLELLLVSISPLAGPERDVLAPCRLASGDMLELHALGESRRLCNQHITPASV